MQIPAASDALSSCKIHSPLPTTDNIPHIFSQIAQSLPKIMCPVHFTQCENCCEKQREKQKIQNSACRKKTGTGSPEALHLPLPWLRCKRTDKMPWSLTEYSPGIHQSPKSPAPTVSFPALRAGILKLIHWESCDFCNHSGRQCLKENTILILFRYSLHSHSPLSYCTSGNAG